MEHKRYIEEQNTGAQMTIQKNPRHFCLILCFFFFFKSVIQVWNDVMTEIPYELLLKCHYKTTQIYCFKDCPHLPCLFPHTRILVG